MNNIQIWSLAVDAVAALGSIFAGIGAFVAVLQIRRHWRDDEPKLSCTYLEEVNSFGKDNVSILTATIRVVNTGKVPVTVCGFRYWGIGLGERKDEVSLRESFEPRLVVPGAAVDVVAVAEGLKPDRPPVHISDIDCLCADGRSFRAVRLPGHIVDEYGHKEHYHNAYQVEHS